MKIDFDMLLLVLERGNKIATTANVLTEMSNLLEAGKEECPNRFLQELHNVVLETEEIVVKSADACQVDGFTQTGLSDAALLSLKPNSAFKFWHLRGRFLAKRKKL